MNNNKQEVKRIGDCRLGIPTQCIVQQSAQVGAANHRGKPR